MNKTSMVTMAYWLIVKFFSHIQSLQLSKQTVSKPVGVMTGNVLAIEHEGSQIILNSLDP